MEYSKLSVLVIICMISINPNVSGQKNTHYKKHSVEKMRTENIEEFNNIESLLESRRFVYIFDESKSYYPRVFINRITSKPPYILVIDSLYALFYLNNPYIIKEGNIVNWRLKKDYKRLHFFLEFKVIGPSPFWDLELYFSIDANGDCNVKLDCLDSEEIRVEIPSAGKIVKIENKQNSR